MPLSKEQEEELAKIDAELGEIDSSISGSAPAVTTEQKPPVSDGVLAPDEEAELAELQKFESTLTQLQRERNPLFYPEAFNDIDIVPRQIRPAEAPPKTWMDAFGRAFASVSQPAGSMPGPMVQDFELGQGGFERAAEAKGYLEAFQEYFPSIVTAPIGAGGQATKLLPMAKQMAVGGMKSGVAEQATREVLRLGSVDWDLIPKTEEEVDKALDEWHKSTRERLLGSGAFGAVLGAALSPVARYSPAVAETIVEYAKGGSEKMKRALATLFRPAFDERVGSVSARQAREYIEQVTGVKVPVGVGEAIGTPDVIGKLKDVPENAELSPDALDVIKKRVVLSSMRLAGQGARDSEIADDLIRVLSQEAQGELSSRARNAVKEFTAIYRPQVEKAMAEVANETASLIPQSVATPTVLGNRAKEMIKRGYRWFKNEDAKLFNAARELPEYATAEGKLTNTKTWANQEDAAAVQQFKGTDDEALSLVDEFGRAIEAPESARETIGSLVFQEEGVGRFIQAIGNLKGTQKLDAMRRARTLVGNTIGEDSILPGLGDAKKMALYEALTNDINAAIDALPTGELASALQKANKFHRDNVEKYIGKDIRGAMEEFGAKGGTAPVATIEKLKSKDGPTILNRMVEAAGPNGKELERYVGQFLFNDIAAKSVTEINAATPSVSPTKAIEEINKLAPEIRDKFFPMLEQIKAISRREAALAKLPNPDTALKSAGIDPQLLDEALKSGSSDVQQRLQAAIREKAQLQAKLRESWMGKVVEGDALGLTELAVRNPSELVDQFLNGSFKPKIVRDGVDMLVRTRNTQLLRDLQFRYLDQLMQGAVTARGINAEAIAKGLAAPSKTAMAGKMRETTEALFGANETDKLATMFAKLADLDRAATGVTASTPLIEAAARGAGALVAESVRGVGPVGAANQAAWVARMWDRGRYKLAAHLLTSPELRELAMQPIGKIQRTGWRRVFESFVRASGVPDVELNDVELVPQE